MWPETVIINKVDFLREFVGMKRKSDCMSLFLYYQDWTGNVFTSLKLRFKSNKTLNFILISF